MEIENNCISKKEVLEINDRQVVIIDVRSKEEYESQHISNAKHIPLDQLNNVLDTFSKDNLHVVACGKGGGRSMDGALKLKQNGFSAFWLCNGTFGWVE